MAHYKTTLECRAPAEVAFDYLADFSSSRHWDPSVTRARLLSGGPIGQGTRFEVVVGLAGREIEFEYRLVQYERPRLLVFEAHTDWMRSLDTIELEARSVGCRVHYDADLRLRGAAYLLDLPLHLGFQISGAQSARGLEKALSRL